MKIAITGVAGLVGSNIALELSREHDVVGFDNFVGGYRDNIPSTIKFIEKNVFDITSEDLNGVDVVVHAACTPHEGLSVFSPKTITENTFGISVSLLSESIKAGVNKFVYLSSMARYGDQPLLPFTEDMTPKPQDPYGIAKYAFEETLRSLSEVHEINYVVLVPHNIVGRGQVYTDPFRNVAGIMINRMLRGKQPIIYGDGNQMRCFSDIRDVVDPIVKTVESDSYNGQVINIGPDENFITINELASLIAKKIGFALDPIYLDARPKEVYLANCSANKARELIGYNPKYTLEDTIDSMINWVKARGVQKFDFDSLKVELVNEKTPRSWTDFEILNS
jgi:UDP-glucose 4-epimerase